jgi:cytochrome c
MNGLEFNKIAAAVLIAGILVMVISNIADILYQPDRTFKRGYHIETEENATTPQINIEIEKPIDVAALMAKANIERGKEAAKRCTMCHTFTKDGKNKVGPNLWGVFGAKKTYKIDYSYSKAMQNKGGSWNYDELFKFINNPKKFLPGTKMSFAGYTNPQEIADVIKYLETLK